MKLDEATKEGVAIRSLRRVWATITIAEALELVESLSSWREENAEGILDEIGWHTHFTDADGNELTIEVLH